MSSNCPIDAGDLQTRDQFYTCFLREIGIPYSVKIRQTSKERSVAKHLEDAQAIRQRAEKIVECGHVAELQKQEISKRLAQLRNNEEDVLAKKHTEGLIQMVMDSSHVLDRQNGLLSESSIEVCKRIFETIYGETPSRAEAEVLIEKVLNGLFAAQVG
jgi:regulator of replication initiation timing